MMSLGRVLASQLTLVALAGVLVLDGRPLFGQGRAPTETQTPVSARVTIEQPDGTEVTLVRTGPVAAPTK